MFVGEVRWATTGLGSSWKLSGGRKFSSDVTNSSKNLQVERAVNRRVFASLAETASVSGRLGGRLIHRATAGAATHMATNGMAAGNAACLPNTTASSAAKARTTLENIRL